MTCFVLVHGSWHDESGWAEPAALLCAAGHAVLTPRLPPNDAMPLPAGEIALETYVDAIAAIVAAQDRPVVLVGHSMAGAVISNVAERHPEAVAALVYVAGFLLQDGQSIAGFAQAHNSGGGRGAAAHLVPSDDGTSTTIPLWSARELFYNTCPEQVAQAAALRLRPQPARPRLGKVRVSPGRFGRVPRAYFTTLRDQTLFPPLQEIMLERVRCGRVVPFDTDHSPFLSAPQMLARELAEIPAWAAGQKPGS